MFLFCSMFVITQLWSMAYPHDISSKKKMKQIKDKERNLLRHELSDEFQVFIDLVLNIVD